MLRCSSLSEVCTFDDVTDWVSRVGEWMSIRFNFHGVKLSRFSRINSQPRRFHPTKI